MDLSENWIADDGAANLAELVKARKSLLNVNISGNKATTAQMSAIQFALDQNRSHCAYSTPRCSDFLAADVFSPRCTAANQGKLVLT